ncbi:hypothetical protein ACWEF6_02580 [Amycolatopsis sp. NPDC004772]
MAGLLRIATNVQQVQQFRDLSKRLKEKGRGELRKQLNKAIKDAGRPIVEDVRNAAQGLHTTSSHGGGARQRQRFAASRARSERAAANALRRHGGLRRRVAAATTLEATRRGVRFVVRSAQLPPDQRSLPRHMNSEKGWRHPVFGDTDNWVAQKATPAGFFSRTISQKSHEFRRFIGAQMEQIKKQIEQ